MIEQQVSVTGDAGKLSGTLCLPNEQPERHPLVLMIHGSGPLDRNANIPHFKLDIFNTIAQHLAQQGIASFRYDKRGIGSSEGNYKITGHHELVGDALACLDFMCKHASCNPTQIYVLGHSEGSIIAPQLALQRADKIAGLILLTPFMEQGEALLRRQAAQMRPMLAQLSGWKSILPKLIFRWIDPAKTQDKLIRKLHATTTPTIRSGLRTVPAKWLREFMALEPETIFQQVTTPCLIIGGGKDAQCRPEDVAAISQTVQGPVDTHLLPNLSHILRNEPGNASLFNYNKLLKKPVEEEVLTLISEWIGR